MRIIHGLKKIYSLLLPYQCVFCANPSLQNRELCAACLQELPILTDSCLRCALPHAGTDVCASCSNSPPPFDQMFALFQYEKPVTRLILTLKFQHALNYGRLLGELLTEKIQEDWYLNTPLPELIIPMPLHPKRIAVRGFNQAVEIAKPIAKALKIPLNYTIAQRSKHTNAQATLNAEQRAQNIKNAFQIAEGVQGKHIAVLDDVVTTGATLHEFTQQLKQAGATKIDVWCCARALT